MSGKTKAVAAAVALFIVWTLATWFLEGRIETLLRPDAVLDRIVYAVVANLLLGIVGAVVWLRVILGWSGAARAQAGFGNAGRTAAAVPAGLILGIGFYAFAGGPTLDAIVILNVFSQVLVVSAAEIIVCWAVLGSATERAMQDRGRWVAIIAAAAGSSVLFGLYHYAHSAPFNTFGMVAFLSAIGLVTSIFFFVSRDVYGTIVFHNFLGVLGVANALAAQGLLDTMTVPDPRLLTMAVVTIVAMALTDRFALRR